MQIQEFPKWFRDIEKKLLTEKVSTIFSSLDRTVDFLIELSTFFGILYQDRVKSLLNHTVKKGDEVPHSEQVLRIYLTCVAKSKGDADIEQVTIILNKAKLYDHLPRYVDVWSCALQEMTKYILAWSMPLQDSILRGCYTIDWIKVSIDEDELEYQNLIMTLFQLKPREEPPEINQINELRLYKRTALKIYGKVERPWAAYICSWLKKKDPSSQLLSRMKSSSFFKILINSSSSTNQKRNVSKQSTFKIVSTEEKPLQKSLKGDLFQDTVDYLCNSKSFLPKSDDFKKKLLRLFESTLPIDRSDNARQTIMHYIYYLEESYIKDQSETFFKNGLDFLNRLIPDANGVVYNFLHGLLHYANCLNQSTDRDAKVFLYKAIDAIELAERKKYDKQIKEFFKEKIISRTKFKIDSSLLNFVKNHTLTSRQWGSIIIRFSRSTAPGPETVPCPFMEPEFHLKLVNEVEKLTRMLKEDMIFDLLYFQMISVSGGIFDIVTQFSTLRNLIIAKYLNDISIPGELCKELEDISGHFLDQFTETLSLDICKLNDRGYELGKTNQAVAAFLSFATYPKDWMPSSELIPLQVKDNQLIFTEKALKEVINCQRQLFPSVESGPTWLVRWQFNEILKIHNMHVILTNPLNNISCSFLVPVKIPLNEEKSLQVCKLMASSLDDLGKDLLSENTECKARELKLTIKKRTRSTSIYGTPQEKFDQHLEFSPLVKHEFETMGLKEEESWLNEIKSDLYEFIKSMRTNFLQSYYFILNPMAVTENFVSSGIQIILSRPGGFYFTSTFIYCDTEMRKMNSDEKLHIRNDDYTIQFLKIYQTIWNEEKTLRNYKDTFILNFYAEDVKEFPVSLRIDNLYLDDKIEQKDKVEQVSTTLENEEEKMVQISMILEEKEPYTLTIKRPLFKDEKEFQEFMLWQIAVACNDNKEGWLWKY